MEEPISNDVLNPLKGHLKENAIKNAVLKHQQPQASGPGSDTMLDQSRDPTLDNKLTSQELSDTEYKDTPTTHQEQEAQQRKLKHPPQNHDQTKKTQTKQKNEQNTINTTNSINANTATTSSKHNNTKDASTSATSTNNTVSTTPTTNTPPTTTTSQNDTTQSDQTTKQTQKHQKREAKNTQIQHQASKQTSELINASGEEEEQLINESKDSAPSTHSTSAKLSADSLPFIPNVEAKRDDERIDSVLNSLDDR